ncbi:TetR family transcriptional regulator [Acidiphilium multivorum]|uniref:TetR family transcriptional regulator n=2 Tax=Acidiphilium TaxID=522 RepID=UPI001B8B70B1|nr:TetR family transcriptional regulator [Acidiphilium multivorum]MBS3022818.1 TetR family transcriptional regulator [Acidiphilium multivorum]
MVQDRSLRTRHRIHEGAVSVLAEDGVAGLTHRAVAAAAGVSLAATTYHFDSKTDLIASASRHLMSGYLDAFARLERRVSAGEATGLARIDDLVTRVVLNALGRERTRSLAWCELILHGGRGAEGRRLAQDWYARLDDIWHAIGENLGFGLDRRAARATIDRAIGLTFLLHPLGLDQEAARDLIEGRLDPAQLGPPAPAPDDAAGPATARQREARARIVQATIDILVESGAGAVSWAAIAERAGLARSGPAYYFPAIGALLATAQVALFDRAKARYRAGFGAIDPAEIDEMRLVDLTTAIWFREVLEHAREALGHYAVFLRAAQAPGESVALRAAIAATLRDQHGAWRRRLAAIAAAPPHPAGPLAVQAVFVGKLIRAAATGADTALLALAREDFAAAIAGAIRPEKPYAHPKPACQPGPPGLAEQREAPLRGPEP